jgi:hypothetical protein
MCITYTILPAIHAAITARRKAGCRLPAGARIGDRGGQARDVLGARLHTASREGSVDAVSLEVDNNLAVKLARLEHPWARELAHLGHPWAGSSAYFEIPSVGTLAGFEHPLQGRYADTVFASYGDLLADNSVC